MCGKKVLVTVAALFFLLPALVESSSTFAPPIAARIGGTVTVDGTQLTRQNDDGYIIKVVNRDRTPYFDLMDNHAEDTDGLNDYDWYMIDIPMYDQASQPGGANPGETAFLEVYKDGSRLDVLSPANGEFTTGDKGSTTRLDLEVTSDAAPSSHIVFLTEAAPNHTITAGSDVRLYGTAVSNQITLESGASAELINFPGFNTVQFRSSADGFTVFRTGTIVTFQGPDGTVLKIPATRDIQIIGFADRSLLTLSIHNNRVMLDDQVIMTTGKPIDGDATAVEINAFTAAEGHFDAGDGNYIFLISLSNYTQVIKNFAPGDALEFPADNAPTVNNISFSDGIVDVQYAFDGFVSTVQLTGLDPDVDAQLLGVQSFEIVFGENTIRTGHF
jgi:hypothetical protein